MEFQNAVFVGEPPVHLIVESLRRLFNQAYMDRYHAMIARVILTPIEKEGSYEKENAEKTVETGC